ncbi:MAG: hypothetical protein ACE5GB_05070 [Acidimicrobiales bacterium]
MALVTCPSCEEDEDLLGSDDGGTITVTCGRCGCVWERDLEPRCDRCGSTGVREALQAIVDKSRGTQLSIQSMRLVHLCPECDADRLAEYLRSNRPLPPAELPVDPR